MNTNRRPSQGRGRRAANRGDRGDRLPPIANGRTTKRRDSNPRQGQDSKVKPASTRDIQGVGKKDSRLRLPPINEQGQGQPRNTNDDSFPAEVVDVPQQQTTLPKLAPTPEISRQAMEELDTLVQHTLDLDELCGIPDEQALPSAAQALSQWHMAHVDRDVTRQALALHRMGSLQLQRALQTRDMEATVFAAGLFMAAMARTDNNKHVHSLRASMERVQEAVGEPAGEAGAGRRRERGVAAGGGLMVAADRHRAELSRIRTTARRQLRRVHEMWQGLQPSEDRAVMRGQEADVRKESFSLRNKVKADIKTLLARMITECTKAMTSAAPCEYAVVATGNLAADCSPYPNVDFVIVLEDWNHKHIDYFRRFATLLHIKVISLGETPLSAIGVRLLKDIYNTSAKALFDPFSSNGIKVDINNSLKHGFEKIKEKFRIDHQSSFVIGKAEDLAKCVVRLSTCQEFEKAVNLLKISHVAGSQDLFTDIKDEMVRHFGLLQDERLNLASSVLMEYLAPYDLEYPITPLYMDPQMFALRAELSNFPQIVFTLRLIFNLQNISPWRICEELRSRFLLDEEGEHDLKTALGLAAYIQTNCQLEYSGNSVGSVLLQHTTVDGKVDDGLATDHRKAFTKNGFTTLEKAMGTTNPSMLFRIYSVLLSLVNELQTFVASHKKPMFSLISFFNTNSDIQAHVFHRCLKVREAIGAYKSYVVYLEMRDPSSHQVELFSTLIHIGMLYLRLGNIKDARVLFNRAIEVKDNMEDLLPRILSFSRAWVCLGLAFLKEDNYSKAGDYMKQALGMFKDMTEGEYEITGIPEILTFYSTCYELLGIVCRRRGELEESVVNFQAALEHRKSLDLSIPSSSYCYLLREIGEVSLSLADYRGAHYYFKEALSCYKKMLGGHVANVDVAVLFLGLSSACEGLGKLPAASYYASSARDTLYAAVGECPLVEDENECKAQIRDILKMCPEDIMLAARQLALLQHKDNNSLSALCLMECSGGTPKGKKDKQGQNPTSGWDELVNIYNTALVQFDLERYEDSKSSVICCLESFEELSSKKSAMSVQVAQCHRLLGLNMIRQGDDKGGLLKLQDTVDSLRDVCAANSQEESSGNNIKCIQLAILELLKDVSRVQVQQQRFSRAIDVLHEVADIEKRVYGNLHPKVAGTATQMGAIYTSICDCDAATTKFNEALDLYKRVYGEHLVTSDIAGVYQALGETSRMAGKVKVAERFLTKAVTLQQELHGRYVAHPDTVEAMVRLGDYYRENKQTSGAVEWHKNALDIVKAAERHGSSNKTPNINSIAHLNANIAMDFQAAELYADAIKFYDIAISAMQVSWRGDKEARQMALWYRDLGKSYDALGSRDQAAECYQMSLTFRQEFLTAEDEEDDPDFDVTDSLVLLAEHLERKGEYKRAIPLRKQCLQQARRAHAAAPTHAEVREALEQLIADLRQVGQYEPALRHSRELGGLLEALHGAGADAASRAAQLRVQARIHQGLAQFHKALRCYEESLAMFARLSPEQRSVSEKDNVFCLIDMGKCLITIGENARAVVYLREALTAGRGMEAGADRHLALPQALMALGWANESYPNFQSAADLYDEALGMYEAVQQGRSGHPDPIQRPIIGECLCALGRTLNRLGRHADAVEFLFRSLAQYSKAFGESVVRQEVIEAQHELGCALLHAGRPEECVQHLQSVLRMARQKYGTDRPHLQIASYTADLAEALTAAGRHDHALQEAAAAIATYRAVLRQHTEHPALAALISLMADVHLKMGDIDTAIHHYKDAAHMCLVLHHGNALNVEVEKAMLKLRHAKRQQAAIIPAAAPAAAEPSPTRTQLEPCLYG